MTTALFILRCKQIGLSISELDQISFGMVTDILIENQNDDFEYDEIATQEDIDNF